MYKKEPKPKARQVMPVRGERMCLELKSGWLVAATLYDESLHGELSLLSHLPPESRPQLNENRVVWILCAPDHAGSESPEVDGVILAWCWASAMDWIEYREGAGGGRPGMGRN